MHIGIAGAGIMGRLLAFQFILEGQQVSLFEKGGDINCSQVAAGLLTPITELDKADKIIYQLGLASLNNHWPAILKALPNHTIHFQQRGCLIIHHPQDKAEWQRFQRIISSKLHHDFFQRLTAHEIELLEPELYPLETAYFVANEGQIDSQAVMNTLYQFLISRKVAWYASEAVMEIKPKQLITDKKTYDFDWVIDCRGLGAKGLLPNLRGVRGELIWLYAPDVHLSRPIRFLHPRYSIYLVPRPGNQYIIGASELEAEDYSTISVRTTLELLSALYSMHAGFSEARILKTETQVRPTLPHHLPTIQYADGLIIVNGLYRHGYLIAPALATEIVSHVFKTAPLHYPELWDTHHDYHIS